MSFRSVLTQSTLIPLLVEDVILRVYPPGPVASLSTHCFQGWDLPSVELPDEGKGNARRASEDLGLGQLPTSHKPIKQEY